MRSVTGTTLAATLDPRWVLLVIATAVASVGVSLTGFCLVGNVLRKVGFSPRLGTGSAARGDWHFVRTDRWYLERHIYLAVGINLTIASVLSMVHSAGESQRRPWPPARGRVLPRLPRQSR